MAAVHRRLSADSRPEDSNSQFSNLRLSFDQRPTFNQPPEDDGNTGVAVDDLPNQLSAVFASPTPADDRTISDQLNYSQLVSTASTSDLSESLSPSSAAAGRPDSGDSLFWEMNHREAAIFLDEGKNNSKFVHHPSSRADLPAYLVVHSRAFHWLGLVASLSLLSLAFLERPAAFGWPVNELVHASLEILGLSIVTVELALKYRWMGLSHFVRHKRTAIKSAALVIMMLEAVVVLVRRDSHFRATRALRPVFLIDNHHCNGVRRMVRQILQSLPPIIDMLALLFFFMLIFAILGFYLFSGDASDPNFTSLERSFVSLFVLLTTANYPDVMMRAYAKDRTYSLFFIAFLVVHLYFLMNLMLAVVYDTFTRIEKNKFRKLFLHRRRACQLAFRLLVSRCHPNRISFKHFQGLMAYFKPRSTRLDRYLMFKTLDSDRTGFLTLDQFYKVYEASQLNWRRKESDTPWFVDFQCRTLVKLCWAIHRLVNNKWFEAFVYTTIASSAVWQVVEITAMKSRWDRSADTSPFTMVFVGLFGLEASLKMVGFGVYQYFQSSINTFDFVVTSLAIFGLIGDGIGCPFSFVFIVRSLHLLKLFALKTRYRQVMGTFIFLIMKRFGNVSMVVLIVYYFFAIIGMEIFSDKPTINCCKQSLVEQYFACNRSAGSCDGLYWMNNFDNIVNSYVTLFELMVVNNWYILMDAYAIVTTEWSRIYFMTFYIVTMVVITIVIAFVLEAFLFRIQYSDKMGDIDKDNLVTVDVRLSHEEHSFCNDTLEMRSDITELFKMNDLTSSYQDDRDAVVYHGRRTRTKFSFCLKMYEEELGQWIKEYEEEERINANGDSFDHVQATQSYF